MNPDTDRSSASKWFTPCWAKAIRSFRKIPSALPLTACFLGFIIGSASAQTIPFNATVVSTSPAQLGLNWATSGTWALCRRTKGASSWGTATIVSGTTYTDSITAGVDYEYRMTPASLTGTYGYLSAGINVPVIENRGTLVLLVDQSMSTALASEITQLQRDLTGDGWTVKRHDLQRMTVLASATGAAVGPARLAELVNVRNTIIADYNADPANVKQVYILGHLPIPYSGTINYDGHSEHVGAWPSDTYYGDVSATWTDTVANISMVTGQDKRNWNIPGDGKFDQSSLPAQLKLAVGRVDLYNMTKFPNASVSETDLLRRYLRKAHQFRFKQGAYANIDRRALGYVWSPYEYGNKISVAACLGRASTITDSPTYGARTDNWFTGMEQNPTKTYLMGYSAGAGSSESSQGAGSSSDFGCRPSRVVFPNMFGSFFGDWGYDNNFLRAPLAGNANGDSLGLCCYWDARPFWFTHSMGMGETIGYCTLLTQNNGFSQYGPAGSYAYCPHVNLMGDPALRLFMVQPPQNLRAGSSSGSVALNWDASTESNLIGYLVYRSGSPNGPFTKLTPNPITTTSYTDSTVTTGSSYTFMVRTLKLETTPGGTFQNPSQGVFATIVASSSATSIPNGPTGLTVNAANSTHINLAWIDNASNETGYRVERRIAPSTTFVPLSTLGANAVSYTDAGPLTSGTSFYYRIIATGSAGDSLPSDEAYVDGAPGFIDPFPLMVKVDKSAGYVDVVVRRLGGGVGPVGISYATADSTAIAGTHYTAANGTLTWSDGDVSAKTVRVSLLGAGQPQLPRAFEFNLSNPTGGATQTVNTQVIVAISDAGARVPAPWTDAIIGTVTETGTSGQVNGEIGSSLRGGGWLTGGESGRFISCPVSGDMVITAKFEAPFPVHSWSAGGVALMARDNTGRMVAVCMPDLLTFTGTAPNSGAKFYSRAAQYTADTITPSTNNGIIAPCWVRMSRTGDTFTGSVSIDGVSWTVLGSATLTEFPTTTSYGFFHYSSNYLADMSLARFNNISIYTSVGTIPGPATPGASILPVDFGTGTGTTETGFQPYIVSGTSGVGPYSQAFSTTSGTLTVSFPTKTNIYSKTAAASIADNGAFTYGDVMRDYVVTQYNAVSGTTVPPTGSFSLAISGLAPNTAFNLRVWSHLKGGDNNLPYNWWSWNGGQAGLIGTVTNLSSPTYTDNNQFSIVNTVYSNDSGKVLLNLTTTSPSSGALNAFELKSADLVNLVALTGTGPGSVVLSWNAASSVASYLVERSSSHVSGFVQIGTTTSTSYTDLGGTPGQLNYYRVKATNPFFASSYTSVASAIPSSIAPIIQVSVSSLNVNEGSTNTFSVKLSSAPTSNVTVTVTRSGGSSNLTVSGGSSLTFTPANYGTYQAVTIASAQDDADVINDTATFSVSTVTPGINPVSINTTQIDNDAQAAGNLTGTVAALIGTNIGTNSTGSGTVRLDGRWWVDGAGTGTSGTADSFHLESKSVTGNFQVKAKIESLTSNGTAPRAGVMIREGTGAGARYVSLAITAATSGGYKIQSRIATSGTASAEITTSGSNQTYTVPNAWVLLERMGDQISVAVSADDITYYEVSVTTLSSLSAAVEAGVFSSSGTVGSTAHSIISGFAFITTFTPMDVVNGLMGRWNLDGNATDTAALDGFIDNGTLVGSPTYTTGTNVMVGTGALSLTGSQYVSMPTSADLAITGALSLSAWIKPAAYPPAGNGAGIIGKWINAASQRSHVLQLISTGKIGLNVSSDGTANAGYMTTQTVPLNAWSHVVGVYTPSSTIQIYINGVLSGTLSSGIPASIYNSTNSVSIGSFYSLGASTYSLNGIIDDVRIYNRALSAAEISAIYGIRQ